MGQRQSYSTIWKKNIVVILHIYEARAFFPRFCENQETESESCEIKMIIYQPLFTRKNISKAIWYNNINTLQGVIKQL